MAGAGRLHDLDLSAEEAERLRRAFRDERFRDLFDEFVAELNDPEQRRVELQDYRHCRDSAPSPVPRELVVTVELPLLRSAEQAELEIRGRELRLDSQRPAYSLRLRLPYDVDESRGRAAFNRAQRQLQVTLPVVPPRGAAAPGGERLEGAEPAAEGSAEAGPAEAGGEAAPPPELGPGDATRSTCDPPAEPLGDPRCDPPADLPVEPLCDPPADPLTAPSGDPPVDPTSEPLADSPAEPSAEAATDPSTDLPSEPFTEPAEAPTEPPEPPLSRSGAAPPTAIPEPAMPTGDTPPLASQGHPIQTATCPPFRARQDEESLTLLLQVPGIHPQSLRGDVGSQHYTLRFCSDTATFALSLRVPPGAALLSPESSVSISAHNAVVRLAKAPGSTGLWDKFSFGLEPSALQERLFVSEENVDGFLGTALCPSPCSQSALESQALIEVLDVTEDRIQIRVEPQECDAEGTLGSSGGALAGKSDDKHPETKAETKCPAAGTMGKASCASQHCSEPEPPASASAIPGGSGRKEPGLESAAAAGITAPGSGEQQGPGSRAEPPILREVNPEDGSVRILRQHRTRCPVLLHNPLLYQLD